MPAYNDIVSEFAALQISNPTDSIDKLLNKYIALLHQHTGRNVIAYYSGWLHAQNTNGIQINDDDKNGFMATIHQLDRTLGLDLVLHSPGGDIAATESIVDYLRQMFGSDIRAIVPQSAMSAATMISCACKEILMGKHSNLGPIDPQFGGLPAHGVLEEFKTALKQIKKDPALIPLWQSIIGKYHPTFLGECEHAMKWSKEIVRDWLRSGMFHGDPQAAQKSLRITKKLSDHQTTRTHSRHISRAECQKIGLKIIDIEADQNLQDRILSLHHSFIVGFSANPANIKIMMNQKGGIYVRRAIPR